MNITYQSQIHIMIQAIILIQSSINGMEQSLLNIKASQLVQENTVNILKLIIILTYQYQTLIMVQLFA